jgi:hypothetical protein
MYPFFIIVYIWAGVYVAFLSVLLYRERTEDAPLIPTKFAFVIVAAVTLIPRLVFLGLNEFISLDSLWYLDFGKYMMLGNVPYFDFYFPYPPVFSYVILFVMNVWPSVDMFRVIASLLDVGVAFMIWTIVRDRFNLKWASTAALAYALIPISIIESGWNGHFEPLVNVFLLLSIWLLLRGRLRLSGVFIALGVATKIYPIVLVPIALLYCDNWKHRAEFIVSSIATGIATILPIAILGLISPTSAGDAGTSSDSAMSLETYLFQLIGVQNVGGLLSNSVLVIVAVGLLLSLYVLFRNNDDIHRSTYYWASAGLGMLLFVIGVLASFYPLLPVSQSVYWRYPIDIGIIRGTTSASVGLYVIWRSMKRKRNLIQEQISRENVALLLGGLLLLLLAFSRGVFYGWYLLWSIPFFLLLRDRRLGLTIIVCLLLVYPSYTHDNFNSLGFNEIETWRYNFDDVESWDVSIRPTVMSNVSGGIFKENSSGVIWFDTRNASIEETRNTTITISKAFNFELSSGSEFVVRITSNWNPTFGAKALLAIQYYGVDALDRPVNTSLIPPSTLFTNLTSVLWRGATIPSSNATYPLSIRNISLIMLPQELTLSSYRIDFIYTTTIGLLNSRYFVIIPGLIIPALAAYLFLDRELMKTTKKFTTNPLQ